MTKKGGVILGVGVTILLIIAFVVLVILLTPSQVKMEEGRGEGLLEFLYKDKDNSLELYYFEGNNETLYIHNGETHTLSRLPRKPLGSLELPEVEGQEDIRLVRDPVYEGVWESSLDESAKLVNHLISEGYGVTREVRDPQSIEIILNKGETNLRLVIFNDIIMVGKLHEGAKLQSFEDYLNKITKRGVEDAE